MEWDWAWWAAAGLIAVVVEMFVLDFVLLMLAAAAGVAALLAFFGAPLWLQVAGFVVTAFVLLRALRPWLLRNLRKRIPLEETNVHALVGRAVDVLADVDPRGGQVKLAGEVWSARTTGGQIAVGQEARVVRIDGATAVVGPLQQPAEDPPEAPGTSP